MAITRRQLIEGLGVFGLLSFFTPLINLTAEASTLRPPKAVNEGKFNLRCIRCQKCGEECPTGAIYFGNWLQGNNADTPFIKSTEQCSLCMNCINICPSGALLPLKSVKTFDRQLQKQTEEKIISDRNLGVAQIILKDCILYKDYHRKCLLCYDVCPKPGKALRLDEYGRPIIDKVLCYGCGLCQRVCPPSAIDLPLRPTVHHT